MGKDRESRRIQHANPSEAQTNSTDALRPRVQFMETYSSLMEEAVAERKKHQILEKSNNTIEDLTPHLLEDNAIKSKLIDLSRRLENHEIFKEEIPQREFLPKHSSHRLVGQCLDDVLSTNVSTYTMISTHQAEEDSNSDEEPPSKKTLPFIKIVLTRSKEILLFEYRSLTVPRGTKEAERVDADNKMYDMLLGKGRMRRTNTSETQTVDKLYKARETNTPFIGFNTDESLVSNFLMFKSFQYANSIVEDNLNVNEDAKLTTALHKADESSGIFKKPEFQLALMTMLRTLAGNVFEKEQRRFRNLITTDSMARDVEYKYKLNLLFQFHRQTMDRNRKSIADLSFCPGNGDIIAVAYGIYSFSTMHVPPDGYCAVWNIKNPINPERIYWYNAPVVSVEFSPYTPQLLAIGLYDGRVEIHDISTFSEHPIAVSSRTKDSTCDPIIALEWMPQVNVNAAGVENAELMEMLLALSQNGNVTKYRIIRSPYLLAFKQMQLDRVEGNLEGLRMNRTWDQTQSNRYPQGLALKKHPSQHDLYYILTDEGCVHKCSTNYPHQPLEVLQAHTGSVSEIDFSPWSPKLFLTCGNDWCIRIWMDGILEPLITLKHKVGAIHCAAWSKTHSTIIISNTRKYVNIWDIRRCTLKPVASTRVGTSFLTTFKFSRCGRSIAIGNERGSVLVVALDDLPFPPHFQYEELELAIYRAIALKPVLTNELKSIGFFGYSDQKQNPQRQKIRQCGNPAV